MTQNNIIQFPAHRVGSQIIRECSESATQPGTHLDQSPAQVFNIQNYIPKGRSINLIEASKGTHQIPHKIFEFLIKATSSRVEMAVFACLLRYTLGFHRSQCEASYSFISEWTGLSIASVRKGLESLLSEKLIRCSQVGSFRESAIYEIPLVKDYLEFLKPGSENQRQLTPQQSQSVCTQGAQGGAVQSAPSTHTSVHPVCTKKDNTNIQEKKNSLSEPETNLKSYFSNILPEVKKKKELSHFQSLRKIYSVEEIAGALKLLLEDGIPGSSELCHSPMAFLSCSMANVLAQVQIKRTKAEYKKTQQDLEADRKSQEATREAEEEIRSKENKRLFEKAFPTPEQQTAMLDDFAVRFPFFKKNSFALKAAAIGEWASKLNR